MMNMSGLSLLPPAKPHSWREALCIGLCSAGGDQIKLPSGEVKDEEENLGLAADIDYDIDNGVLSIAVRGPLDLRCTTRLLAISRAADDSIASCRLILDGVTRVFDSGIAALILLAKVLTHRGVDRIRIEGLDLNRPSLSPYRSGTVAASMRRVFIW
mgnify:CR=1 FL=1